MENVVILDASVAIKAILPNPLLPHCQALTQTFARVQPVDPALWDMKPHPRLRKPCILVS
jgi:hypothetical protein